LIVQCEHCNTKYRIPDEKVKEKGVKVRCPKCNNTFVVLPSRQVRTTPSSTSLMPPPPEEKPADESKETSPPPLGEAGINPPERPREPTGEAPAVSGEKAQRPGGAPLPDGQVPGDLPAGAPADDDGLSEIRAARPAHEKDRPKAVRADDEPGSTPGPEGEEFEIETTTREDAPPLSGEPGPSSGVHPPPETVPSHGSLEDWGNIPLDSEGESKTDETRIGLGEESRTFSPSLLEDKVFPDLGTGSEGELPPQKRPLLTDLSPPKPKKGKTGKCFVFLLVLALLGAGGYLAYRLAYPKVMDILYEMEILVPKTETQEEILKPNKIQVRSLARQDGKMIYTVHGEVRNDSSVSVGMIQIEAQFRDSADGIVARSRSFCGNVFEDEQLITGDLAKIRADLQNELGQSLSNSNVKPGQAVPFLILLEDPPSTINKVTVTISGFKETT